MSRRIAKASRTTPDVRSPPARLAHTHVVLAAADGESYRSLRHRPVSRAERFRIGRNLRHSVPRSALGLWKAPRDRPDPVAQIIASHDDRLERLVRIRVGRMIASPYGFLRGAAVVMAEDVAHLPATGIFPVICGDAHLGNFGFYASPERHLVMDLNDFDEAHPGAWEWDLRRLVVSIWVAGRQNRATEQQCRDAVMSSVAAYRHELSRLANEPLLLRAYERIDVDALRRSAADTSLRDEIKRAAKRAQLRTSDRALPRFTTRRDGRQRIVHEPPLISALREPEWNAVASALDDYLGTIGTQWQRVLGGYTLVDIAHKVVGVGSVGLRAYVALLEGSSADDVVFLQLKQARRSVLARYVHGDSARHAHQGQRVVEYQHALQTVSDPLLGWTTIEARQFYVRQFRDMKGSVMVESISPRALTDYAAIVGRLLAKGHARTSGASMIAGYVGTDDNVDRAMCRFARAYADQTEADHAALVKAVARGILAAETERQA